MLNNSFWDEVDIKDENECWFWKGSVSSSGYGVFRFRTVLFTSAHRVAWEIANKQSIPKFIDGMKTVIRHTCDNKLCVNPNHLVLGNHRDNMMDARRKGVGLKYDEETFREVIKLRFLGYSYRQIKEKLGVSRTIVYRMVYRKGIYKEWPIKL